MILLWHIRCFHTQQKVFFDRNLFLDTRTLAPAQRLAIEGFVAARGVGVQSRECLKFRSWFREEIEGDDQKVMEGGGFNSGFGMHSYHEDENAHEISLQQAIRIQSGNDTAVVFPSGVPPHHMELVMAISAGEKLVDFDVVKFEAYGQETLRLFCQNCEELKASPFMHEEINLSSNGSSQLKFETSLTPSEIQAAILLFRRLTAEGEKANFKKTAKLMEDRVGGILAAEVRGWCDAVEKLLDSNDNSHFFIPIFGGHPPAPGKIKQLFDAYTYGQIIHVGQEEHVENYVKWVAWAKSQDRLHFLFLFLLRDAFCSILAAYGNTIGPMWHRYQAHHGISIVPPSTISNHSGLGAMEKPDERKQRIFEEQTAKLAHELWVSAGRSQAGPQPFMEEAQRQLRNI